MPKWEMPSASYEYIPLFQRDTYITEKDVLPEPDPYAALGFLSPAGKLYPAPYSGHNFLQAIIERDFNIKDLQESNWVVTVYDHYLKRADWMFLGLRTTLRPTREQERAIIDWCAHYEVELPSFMELFVPSRRLLKVPGRRGGHPGD